jgi:hypothetical protein
VPIHFRSSPTHRIHEKMDTIDLVLVLPTEIIYVVFHHEVIIVDEYYIFLTYCGLTDIAKAIDACEKYISSTGSSPGSLLIVEDNSGSMYALPKKTHATYREIATTQPVLPDSLNVCFLTDGMGNMSTPAQEAIAMAKLLEAITRRLEGDKKILTVRFNFVTFGGYFWKTGGQMMMALKETLGVRVEVTTTTIEDFIAKKKHAEPYELSPHVIIKYLKALVDGVPVGNIYAEHATAKALKLIATQEEIEQAERTQLAQQLALLERPVVEKPIPKTLGELLRFLLVPPTKKLMAPKSVELRCIWTGTGLRVSRTPVSEDDESSIPAHLLACNVVGNVADIPLPDDMNVQKVIDSARAGVWLDVLHMLFVAQVICNDGTVKYVDLSAVEGMRRDIKAIAVIPRPEHEIEPEEVDEGFAIVAHFAQASVVTGQPSKKYSAFVCMLLSLVIPNADKDRALDMTAAIIFHGDVPLRRTLAGFIPQIVDDYVNDIPQGDAQSFSTGTFTWMMALLWALLASKTTSGQMMPYADEQTRVQALSAVASMWARFAQDAKPSLTDLESVLATTVDVEALVEVLRFIVDRLMRDKTASSSMYSHDAVEAYATASLRAKKWADAGDSSKPLPPDSEPWLVLHALAEQLPMQEAAWKEVPPPITDREKCIAFLAMCGIKNAESLRAFIADHLSKLKRKPGDNKDDNRELFDLIGCATCAIGPLTVGYAIAYMKRTVSPQYTPYVETAARQISGFVLYITTFLPVLFTAPPVESDGWLHDTTGPRYEEWVKLTDDGMDPSKHPLIGAIGQRGAAIFGEVQKTLEAMKLFHQSLDEFANDTTKGLCKCGAPFVPLESAGFRVCKKSQPLKHAGAWMLFGFVDLKGPLASDFLRQMVDVINKLAKLATLTTEGISLDPAKAQSLKMRTDSFRDWAKKSGGPKVWTKPYAELQHSTNTLVLHQIIQCPPHAHSLSIKSMST